MKRICGGCILLIAAVVSLFSGCDSPNSPDLPPQPYHVAAVYSLPAEAKDVVAVGGFAAVAAGSYGAVVLNVQNLAHVDTVFRDTVTRSDPFSGVSKVALDTLHHIVAWTTEPRIALGMTSYNYATGEVVTRPNFQGPYYDFRVEVEPNMLTYWGSAHNKFECGRVCRDTDTSSWAQTCNPPFVAYEFPRDAGGGFPERGEGFAHRVRDGVLAVSVRESGVHFLDDSTGALRSIQIVPGAAYDCAWYQDSLLVVACDFEMAIMNVSDPAQPYVISQYVIPNADRLRGVAIDGNWACMMDGYDGIYIVDISHPRQPAVVQLLKLTHPTSVCVDNGRLYASDEASGLVIYTH